MKEEAEKRDGDVERNSSKGRQKERLKVRRNYGPRYGKKIEKRVTEEPK